MKNRLTSLVSVGAALLMAAILGLDAVKDYTRHPTLTEFQPVACEHVLDMSDGEKETVLVDLADSRGFIGGCIRVKYDEHVHVYVCSLDFDPQAGAIATCYVRVKTSGGAWRAGTAVRTIDPEKLKALGVEPDDPDNVPDPMLMDPPTDDSPARSST